MTGDTGRRLRRGKSEETRRQRSAAISHEREPSGVYIKQAAQMVGVSPTVLRAWEAEGLVSPERTHSGYRIYSVTDVTRLRFVRDLIQRDGLNPAGVRRLLGFDAPLAASGPEGNGDEGKIGGRIRRLRKKRGVSLRQLATLTGLSPSYVSSLERSLSKPSIASLQKLAAALGTNVPTLLGERQDPKASPLVRPADRRILKMEVPGVTFENLAVIETNLQPILVTVAPGAGSQEAYRHEGEEFLYMLEGELEFTLDEEYTYNVRVGDSLTFASDRPHRWWNPGEIASISVWINTPQTF